MNKLIKQNFLIFLMILVSVLFSQGCKEEISENPVNSINSAVESNHPMNLKDIPYEKLPDNAAEIAASFEKPAEFQLKEANSSLMKTPAATASTYAFYGIQDNIYYNWNYYSNNSLMGLQFNGWFYGVGCCWFQTYGWSTVTLPNGAETVSTYVYEYGSYYNPGTFYAYDESGQYIGQADYTYSYTGWTYKFLNAPAGRKIKTVVFYGYYSYWTNLNVWYAPINAAPVANAGNDQTIECSGELNTVLLNGSSSTDPDGDALTYSWSLGGAVVSTAVSPSVDLELGSHTFTLTVTDPAGLSSSDDVVVNIVDTTPPTINLNLLTGQLWPPNHKMQLVVSGISASDNCCSVSTIVTVTSNESSNGAGDGNTSNDWKIEQNTDGTYNVYVLSERSGKGSGRVYTITVTAEDCAGNSAGKSETVTVAKSKG